jgi:hypothetical protein
MGPKKGVWTTIKPIAKSTKKTSAAKTKSAAKKKKTTKAVRAPRSVGKSIVANVLHEMTAAGEI